MLSEFCLDINSVAMRIGEDIGPNDIRICLPYMNIAMEIGDETPFIWPPDVLREAETGGPLLGPETGTPLLIAGS